MKEISELYLKNEPIEIQHVEKVTSLEYQEVIFDSEYYDWKWKTSLFDEILLNREKLMIAMQNFGLEVKA